MASSRIASRYSKSLFDLASHENKIEQVKEDMILLETFGQSSTELVNLLKNPIVKADVKQSVMDKILVGTEALTQKLVSFLLQKKREEELFTIATQFLNTYRQMKGISQATVISAVSLSEKNLSMIQKYVEDLLGQPGIQLNNEIDLSILGGIVVKHEDMLLDKSVSKELREIRKQIIYN